MWTWQNCRLVDNPYKLRSLPPPSDVSDCMNWSRPSLLDWTNSGSKLFPNSFFPGNFNCGAGT